MVKMIEDLFGRGLRDGSGEIATDEAKREVLREFYKIGVGENYLVSSIREGEDNWRYEICNQEAFLDRLSKKSAERYSRFCAELP